MNIVNPYRFAGSLRDKALACWNFDETTGTAVSDKLGTYSGTANNITMNQTGITNVTPCFSFNGSSSYVNFGNVLGFENTDSFSIAVWINQTNSSVSREIICKAEGSPNYRGFELYLPYSATDSFPTFILRNSTTNALIVQCSSSISKGVFHHLGVTYDGSKTPEGVKFYIDGVLKTHSTSQNNLTATILNTQNLTVGGKGASVLYYGKMMQVGILNSVIAEADFLHLYNLGNGLAFENW